MKTLIKHDLYNITNRIKKVDKNYQIYFDKTKKVYEVFCGSVFSFMIGKRLDKSAIDKAYKTHIRNAKKIFSFIKENNSKLRQKEEETIAMHAKTTLNDYLNYADKKGKDVSFDNINQTRWI